VVLAPALAAWLATMTLSGMASIKPTPKTGVGILKMRLLFLVWYAKSSWLIVQPLASPVESRRPLMTNSAWTPPSRVPSALYL